MIQVWNRLAIQNEAAVCVRNCESVATFRIPTLERAFELHAPHLIRTNHLSQWLREFFDSFLRSLHRQSVAL